MRVQERKKQQKEGGATIGLCPVVARYIAPIDKSFNGRAKRCHYRAMLDSWASFFVFYRIFAVEINIF